MVTRKMVTRKITKKKHNTKLNPIKLNLTSKQIEFILLYKTLINHLLLLIRNKIPKHIIKETIINLFKEMRHHDEFIKKNTSESQLNILFTKLFKQAKQIEKDFNKNNNNNNKNNNKSNKIKYASNKPIHEPSHDLSHHPSSHSIQKGGFYFKSLEEKGDKPLTGNDLATLLDEMQKFFYNAQYTDEGKFLQDTNALISMFRGDVGQFKGLLQYKIFPQYYQVTPPFLKWDNIKKAFEDKKYEDIPDYLLAYQTYLRSRDEYLVAKGLKSPSVLGRDRYTGVFNNLANSLDKNITQFQQYRNKATGKISPIALPV